MFVSAASICDLFLLFFIPFLSQLYASTRGALWWVTKHENQLQSIRVVNGAIGLFIVVICLEVRVVFHSFGRYIQAPPPLNYLLVTITMLGGASAAGAYALGMVSDALNSIGFTAAVATVSVAGAIVVGFPVLPDRVEGGSSSVKLEAVADHTLRSGSVTRARLASFFQSPPSLSTPMGFAALDASPFPVSSFQFSP